ncbi:hypothetical protein EON65_20185 [archaeon]|nr:MAG: hypothetical protein EON65_20185 [archaeon]
MKDLLGKMITSTLSADYLQQVGSSFIKTSKIQDLANKLPSDKKERERAVKKADYGQQGLGLSNIFDEEEDPDL